MWAAYGKHPALKDYFRVGQDFPLLSVFSGWVENGYKQFSKSKSQALHNVWHFWARGASEEFLVCGLLRDSADGIGRNYPLLIIGTGPVSRWEEDWDLLPLACAEAWRDIDRLSVLQFDDIKTLEAEVRSVSRPQSRWQEFKAKRESLLGDSGAIRSGAVIPADRKESFIPLDLVSQPDRSLQSSGYCSLFKSTFKAVPSVVFTGESLGQYFIRFYSRPLTPTDFVHLWTAGEEKQKM